ncbi:protein unc-13 homolog [Oryza brachyantha]|uniref:protein unc-13 homolog n=1 Tax=Oryza brachyantha TaxID=4533 RepID=UPI001ADA0740|nr:protein unc-13 homolog [Oryza brachyantha]
MGRLQHYHRSRSASSFARSSDTAATDSDVRSLAVPVAAAAVDCPFGHVDGLTRAELREAAYEVFFMSCRIAGGGRLNYFPAGESGGDGSPTIGAGPRGGTGMNVVSSRVKRALGLKARRSSQPTTARIAMNASSAPGSPRRAMRQASTPVSPGKGRRPMTSAEIMRQQMRVAEQSDARLRKTLMRTLVGQVGRKAETIILPLELLRQLKPTDFANNDDYHQWQRRQLKLLEAGLVVHPSLPHDHLSVVVLRFRDVVQATDARAIDTGKTSDAMQALCNAVHALAWRPTPGSRSPSEACHWADGYPLNVLLYVSLLQAIFDLKEETVVLDEVDELLELMKRTWTTLGINKMMHNVCFAWVLFRQYVVTDQIEPDLAGAALVMLTEVATDAKQENHDPVYSRVLSSTIGVIHDWSEKMLLDYHEWYGNDNCGAMAMESALSLALATSKIIADNATGTGINTASTEDDDCSVGSFAGDCADYYVRCSMRSAFTKLLQNGLRQGDGLIIDRGDDDPSDILARLASDTEQIALWEYDSFSPVLRRWHPFPGAVAAVTLHGCYGVMLKQYLGKASGLTNELVHVLHAAGRLEKALVQMVVEDVADSDDGGKSVVREVAPYDVESVVVEFLRTWILERLRICKECLHRAKETESWMPRSKNEPYAQSAVELMKVAKATVDEFFGIPVSVRDDMVQDLANGMETIFHEYISFLASCGNKQSYLPSLPLLTRCNQDSKIIRLWKKAATPCRVPVSSPRGNVHHGQGSMASGGQNPRPSTSRGTQRLYVRLNTLHFILSHIHALDKSLSFFSHGRCSSPAAAATTRLLAPSSHFDRARTAAQSAVGHVAEVAAYRLIFLDSHHSFYDGLYVGGVADARIRPALRTLKQNLSLLLSVLVDRAQPVAVREVMKASFQSFLLVLLAGGSDRSFTKDDHDMVEEDFRSLKRAFCTRGEGLVTEEVVDGEAEAAESVVALMGQTAEQLVEELSIACELSAVSSAGQRMPVPATTWRWSRTDPNTILRVLCHRDDVVASHYLKRTFQLPKRR